MIMVAALLVVIIILIVAIASGAAARRKRESQIQALATGIETLRRAATRDMRRRTPGPADALAGELLALYDSNATDMRGAGLTLLGDQIEEQDDGSPMGTSRWFVDDSGTICGWFGALPVTEV